MGGKLSAARPWKVNKNRNLLSIMWAQRSQSYVGYLVLDRQKSISIVPPTAIREIGNSQ